MYNARMNNLIKTDTVRERFLQPMLEAFEQCELTRNCSEYSDRDHLMSGVQRVIQNHRSGRAWIQHCQLVLGIFAGVAVFFQALKSKRRMEMVVDVAERVRLECSCRYAGNPEHDPLAQHPELDRFSVYASDGHTHAAASHDKPVGGKIRPVNHIYSLCLRTHFMAHIDLTQPAKGKKKEHEISTLKRVGAKALRMREKTGTKVVHVYDPAIVDYQQWHRWKQGSGIYIITMEKSNSAFTSVKEREFDAGDKRNTGIVSDEIVLTSKGGRLRRIRYVDPETGKHFSFIANEFSLPPGLIAFLYKLRWDVEKTFDQVKNLFCEKKAWAGSAEAKCQQAAFITIAHNLTLMLEREIKTDEGIEDIKTMKRKARRIAQARAKSEAAGVKFNPLVEGVRRVSKRSAQFIRWLQSSLEHRTCWEHAIKQLRPLMEEYLS